MNITAIIMCAIICTTVVCICWIERSKGDKK